MGWIYLLHAQILRTYLEVAVKGWNLLARKVEEELRYNQEEGQTLWQETQVELS